MYLVIIVKTFHEIRYSKMLNTGPDFFHGRIPRSLEKSDVSKGFGLWELTIKRSQTHLAACCDCPLGMSVGFSLKC